MKKNSFYHQLKPWLVCLSAALFFFYEFIQMNMLNGFSQTLMATFQLSPEDLGLFSSSYFLANVIFLIPAGVILDRYSTRKIILTTFSICIFGNLLFSQAHTIHLAIVGRFLAGIGSAFCFLSSMRLATRWFPTHRLALITGLIVTFAMSGGAVAQEPMVWLLDLVGWRYAILINAGFGLIFLTIIYIFVADHPEEIRHDAVLTLKNYQNSLKQAYLKTQNWLCAFYTCLMNTPLSLLGALWGILYLSTVHHFTWEIASKITTLLFFGMMLGSPLVGWISDTIGKRKLPMMIGAICSLLIFLLIFIPNHHNQIYFQILFFLLGISSSTQVIAYPLVAETNPLTITAMALSVISFTTIAVGYALLQPFFGWLLNRNANVHFHYVTGHYLSAHAFFWPMMLFPISLILAMLCVLPLREKR